MMQTKESTAHEYWVERVDLEHVTSLHDLLARTTERFGDRTAVRWNGQSLTWTQLSFAVQGRVARLAEKGIGPGTPVAIVLPNNPAFVVSFFAVASLGAIAMPINPLFTSGEINEHLIAGSCSIVITSRDIADRLANGVLEPGVEFLLTGPDGLGDTGPSQPVTYAHGLFDVALYAFSSGSTGKPKRVSRTHFNLVSEAIGFSATVSLSAYDVVLGVAPMFHAHGLGNALLASVASGATLVLTEAFDRRGTLDLIRSERVTFFPGVPLMFSALTAVRQSIAEDQRTLRTCFSAGAPLSPEISSKFESKFGVPVRQLYGCSEAGSVTMNLDKDPHIVSGSVGRPTGWGEVRVLDEFGDDQPPGTPGRIAISTPTLTAAYEGMPEATASAFHGRWFITGDLGYLDQRGNLYITGREKVFISTGGFKVDPVEVENVLTAHPLVREAVVLGIPQQSGDELVKAVVVGEPELTREGLVAHCKANLATFKVPRTIEFREEMPRNAVGKVLKKYLM